MITFLRRIRKSLIDSGANRQPASPTGRYLLYAIGEILLVMIGILLALQVNNWNEERKARRFELELLNELYTTVTEDLVFNRRNIEANKASKNSNQVLINYLATDLPFNDSLRYHFSLAHQRWVAFIRDNAFQNAKNYGLNFIKKDSTRFLLSWTYEPHYQWLNKLDDRNNLYHYNIEVPVLTQYFEDSHPFAAGLENINDDEMMKPRDYEELKTNKAYLNILKSNIQYRSEYLEYQELLYNSMRNLAESLQEEINPYE